MAESKITLIGFNNYLLYTEPDSEGLFNDLVMPEGIDRQEVIDNILLRGGEFESVYADPYFVRNAIGTWSKKWFLTFKKWLTAINLEYDPIENYNRVEDWTDTDDGTRTGKNTHDENTTYSMAASEAGTLKRTTTDDTDTTSENEVSAYDSSTYQPKDKNTGTLDNENVVDQSTTGQNYVDSGNIVKGSDSSTDTHANKATHSGHIRGNIGVTTSQQMLMQEYEVARFNLYEQITDIFLREFIIPIY